MGWRKSFDVGESSCGRFQIHATKQKIANGLLVETIRNRWMLPNAVKRIADDQGVSHLCVIKRFNTEPIARAKQLAPGPVPDGKREVTKQMIEAGFAPNFIGMQDQLSVVGVRGLGAFNLKLVDQFDAAIDTHVRSQPHFSVTTQRLTFSLGFEGRAQHRVTETDMAFAPDFLRIRTPVSHKARHALKQRAIHGRAIQINNADDSTHSGFSAKLPKLRPASL